MIIDLVNTSIRSLNQTPAQNGISDRISPLTLVTGKGNIDYNNLKLAFGSYVQVLEDNDRTNTTAPRSIGAIALSISPNENGHYRFMNLNTGKVVNRRKYQELPITDAVIRQVEQLALAEGQPKIKNGCPVFGWTPDDDGTAFFEEDDDDPDDSDYDDEDTHDDDDEDMDEQNYDDDHEDIAQNDDATGNEISYGEQNEDGNESHNDDESQEQNDDLDNIDEVDEQGEQAPDEHEEIIPETVTDDDSNVVDDDEMEIEPDEVQRSARAHGHNLRGNRTRDYSHRLDHAMDTPESKKS
jgi:hypothetical protein